MFSLQPLMEYHVMSVEECPKCKAYDKDDKFINCGISKDQKLDGRVIQNFECSRCKYTWEKIYNASSPNNGSTFRGEARQSELFKSHKEIL